MVKHDAAMTAPAAMQRHLPAEPSYSKNAEVEAKISPLSPVTPTSPITPAIDLPSIIPSQPAPGSSSTADAYAIRTDFGKSNLHKWSSVYGMDTPWDANDVTDTEHFKSSTVAFLDTLNTLAQSAGVSFVLTGGAEYGYHAHGTYSHENGYKVDISDSGVYVGTTAYRILLEALTPFKHHLSHEWNNNHYDITIYPADYTGSYSGAASRQKTASGQFPAGCGLFLSSCPRSGHQSCGSSSKRLSSSAGPASSGAARPRSAR